MLQNDSLNFGYTLDVLLAQAMQFLKNMSCPQSTTEIARVPACALALGKFVRNLKMKNF